MRRNLQWRLIAIIGVVIVAWWTVFPVGETVRLGLDLRGGVHLVLQVETEDALRLDAETRVAQLREAAVLEGLALASTRVISPTDVRVEGVGVGRDQDFQRLADELLASYDRDSGAAGTYIFRLTPAAVRSLKADAVRQALQTIERRVNALGVAEPVVTTHGTSDDQILVHLPGVEDVESAKAIIRSTGLLEINLVEAGPAATRDELLRTSNGVVPPDLAVVAGPDTPIGAGQSSAAFYLVHAVAPVTGRDLRWAQPTVADFNRPAIGFSLNREGARKFGRLTAANVGRDLAIVVDGQVASVALIEESITGGEGRIHGSFSTQEASDLSLILRSGALPASLTYLEQRVIGPSLGADSVRGGVTASIAGLIAVALFMLGYYRVSGINAVVAVGLNLLILLACLVYVDAALTLPGIAGLILTIGMGVDSNVLIFERIREELRNSKTVRSAVAAGFDRVFLTILDTHIASLIAAAFLFQFGSGPIQGFATTLFFGLVSNVFTAVFVSRALFEVMLRRRRSATLSI